MDFKKNIKEYYSALTDNAENFNGEVPYSPEEELLKIKKAALGRRRAKIRNYSAVAASVAVIAICISSVGINRISTLKKYDDDFVKNADTVQIAEYTADMSNNAVQTEENGETFAAEENVGLQIASAKPTESKYKSSSTVIKQQTTDEKDAVTAPKQEYQYHKEETALSNVETTQNEMAVQDTAPQSVERVENSEVSTGTVNNASSVVTESTVTDDTLLWSGGSSGSSSSGGGGASTAKPSSAGNGRTPSRGTGGSIASGGVGTIAGGVLGSPAQIAPMATIPPYAPEDDETMAIIADTEYDAPPAVKPSPSPTPTPTPEPTEEPVNN